MQRACELWRDVPSALWISNSTPSVNAAALVLPASKALTVLGREFHLLIFDAWSGLDVNALAAVSGTVRAGGTLVLLTPPWARWSQYPDPDCQRFLPHPWQPAQVDSHFIRRSLRLLHECGPEAVAGPAGWRVEPEKVATQCQARVAATTRDQQQALHAILGTAHPVVLSADRGRGKSAVLGMAARQFQIDGLTVVLTAPARAMVHSVMQHAAPPGAASPRNKADNPVDFYAPDDLLQAKPQADVLLVDEAAAIPLPLLLALLRHYPRCVFATTLQGYEGSGRGFVLRFQRALDRLYPGWLALQLQQPIRWQAGDPLEAFINRWLMMDAAETAQQERTETRADTVAFKPADIKYRLISAAELSDNEPKLREVFHLLVNAHYQTRPSDLRQLLDGPHISVHVLEWRQQVCAVALLAREGGLAPELTAAIHAGQRRPHGHLLAQSLTFHAGIAGAACLHGERIMRIAVAAPYQRQGLGSLLLAQLRAYAERAAADYLGVSYAASPELAAFWQAAGFQSVRLGHRKDKASGSRSLMQVAGLSARGVELATQAHQQFLAG